jgi:hypothetical protein
MERSTNGGYPASQELLSDGPLLDRQALPHGIAVSIAGAQAPLTLCRTVAVGVRVPTRLG